LLAEGITLAHSDQQPTLSQQQALLIASQLEPAAASQANKISARYVLLNYPGTSAATPSVAHPALNNVPVWLVWYRQIPLGPADVSVDPTLASHTYHDLYVCIDATSGKELLSIWV
jgi:hypothetical protein